MLSKVEAEEYAQVEEPFVAVELEEWVVDVDVRRLS